MSSITLVYVHQTSLLPADQQVEKYNQWLEDNPDDSDRFMIQCLLNSANINRQVIATKDQQHKQELATKDQQHKQELATKDQ
jgi:hypothetical protein